MGFPPAVSLDRIYEVLKEKDYQQTGVEYKDLDSIKTCQLTEKLAKKGEGVLKLRKAVEIWSNGIYFIKISCKQTLRIKDGHEEWKELETYIDCPGEAQKELEDDLG